MVVFLLCFAFFQGGKNLLPDSGLREGRLSGRVLREFEDFIRLYVPFVFRRFRSNFAFPFGGFALLSGTSDFEDSFGFMLLSFFEVSLELRVPFRRFRVTFGEGKSKMKRNSTT